MERNYFRVAKFYFEIIFLFRGSQSLLLKILNAVKIERFPFFKMS